MFNMYKLFFQDYHGGWDRTLGANAPLYAHPSQAIKEFNIDYTINYYINNGYPAQNIILGMGTYGRSMTMANSAQHTLGSVAAGAGQAGTVRTNSYFSFFLLI